jgi:hypothetical protein
MFELLVGAAIILSGMAEVGTFVLALIDRFKKPRKL